MVLAADYGAGSRGLVDQRKSSMPTYVLREDDRSEGKCSKLEPQFSPTMLTWKAFYKQGPIGTSAKGDINGTDLREGRRCQGTYESAFPCPDNEVRISGYLELQIVSGLIEPGDVGRQYPQLREDRSAFDVEDTSVSGGSCQSRCRDRLWEVRKEGSVPLVSEPLSW